MGLVEISTGYHGFFVPEIEQTASPRAIAVIPARLASTRLPEKPLADIGGTTMIERVYRRACAAQSVERVVVATDSERIFNVVSEFGEAVMTGAHHASGSDRAAEVAQSADCDIVVNVQGDIPLLDPALIDDLVAALSAAPELEMATAAVPIRTLEEFHDPSVVKLVCDANRRAMYFSRAAIPHRRDAQREFQDALHHVGLYAYRRETLLAFSRLPPTKLECTEKLEQLRALENGIGIGVVVRDSGPPMEVDTPADLDQVRRAVARTASTLSREPEDVQ